MVLYGRSSRSSWAKSVRSSFQQDCYGKGNSRKSYWNTVGKKFRIGNACLLTEKKDYSCVCTSTISNWLKETEYQSDVESTKQRSWFGRTNIILWPCLFGLYSTRMQNKQRYCEELQEFVWNQDVSWWYRKLPYSGKLWSKHLLMVLWHGRSCQEMRGEILWTGEQNNSTVIQSRDAMHGWSSGQEEEWDLLENC